MADQGERIVSMDGVEHHFPADATDAEISSALKAIPATNAPNTPKARTWSLLGAAAPAASTIGEIASEVATNPNTSKMLGTIARVGTTLAGVGHGLYRGNMSEVLTAPLAGWAAGKGGYFLGKGAQSIAAPIANAAEAIEPVATPVARVVGLQSLNDLAQTIEPDRKDIGFLGAAPTREIPKAFTDFLSGKGNAKDAIKALVDAGWTQAQATRAVMNQKVKGQ